MRSILFRVVGRVQGVFFRASAQAKANELGVTGWVRNTQDGDVEIFAEGTARTLEKFLSWCQKGPSAAKVEKIEILEKRDIDKKSHEQFFIHVLS